MIEKESSSNTLRKQPSSLSCFVCGVENPSGLKVRFYDNGVDEVYARYMIPELFQGYPGRVHGGIVATLLDECLGRAMMVQEPNRFMVTAKLTVHYRKPVPIGQTLQLMGKVLRRRGRIAISRSEIRLLDGTLCAEAEGMLMYTEGSTVEVDVLDEYGWRVYPDDLEVVGSGGENEDA